VVAFLQGGDAAPSTQAITGTGGIGKTELCKAALKKWLKEEPNAVAYYVTIPDRGSVANLITNLAAAIGATQIESSEQLLAVLPPALYYLDNLESVAECADGQQFLRNLKETSGVRLLVSSRLDSSSIFRKSLSLGVLPDVAALALFRDTWAGQVLPDDAALRDFVLHDLGAHALSVTITARLGDCYAFGELVDRWRSIGTQVAADVGDESRLGNLNTSLRLTAQVLGQTAGSLELWMLSALFPSGVPHEILQQFEQLGDWDIAARQLLVRHHVLTQRGEFWQMLPPLARYALEASQKEEAGFAWTQCRPLARTVLDARLEAVDSIASTPEMLAARAWVVQHFDAVAQTMRHEIGIKGQDIEWLSGTHSHLINVYQFQPLLARDLLRFLDKHQIAQASVKQRLGDLESRLGQVDTARSLYEQALKLYQSEQAGLGQANTLQALGDLESRLGQVDTARSLYEQALELFKAERDELGQANTLQALGDLESRLGQVDTARSLYEQALKLYQSEQAGLGQANTLQALGDLLREAQQWRDAAQSYKTALALYRQEQDPMGLAYTCAELARCFHALDQYPSRDLALKDALAWAVKSNTPNVQRYVQWVQNEING
jgi:tetratricopeptide (TPR) repeat protein